MEQPGKKNTGVIVGVVAVVIIVVFLAGTAVSQQQNKNNHTAEASDNSTATRPATDTPAPTSNTPASPVGTSTYKDGSYTAEGWYITPGNDGKISVRITLKNNVVMDSTVIGEATNPQSKEYQADFIGGYKAQVTGKAISTLKLGKVSGSSLTPNGFNAALETIKAQAKA